MGIAAPALARAFQRHGSFVLSIATMVALSLYPTPWCFDCEFPDPWGHHDGAIDAVLTVWLLAAPFVAGLFALRRGWRVQLCAMAALLIAQPLGGVSWDSFVNNEGPVHLAIRLTRVLGRPCHGFGYSRRRNTSKANLSISKINTNPYLHLENFWATLEFLSAMSYGSPTRQLIPI